MYTVRYTHTYLARLRLSPTAHTPAPTTRLGDWHANILFRPGGKVALFLNERTLLPVLVAAAPSRTLLARFREAAAEVLLRCGAPAAAVETERREMAEVVAGAAASPAALGAIDDCAALIGAYQPAASSLPELAVRLASIPCGPVLASPCSAARRLLAGG